MTPRKRSVQINTRSTPAEKRELQAAADHAGQSLQAWVLGTLLREARKAKR